MTIEEKIAKLLIRQRKTLAIAESCTGGLLSNRLTNIPGSSSFLKFSVVAYSYESKSKLLKVPAAMLKKHGAVSEQVASAMAQGVRRILHTDFGIGITGIAGPGGATARKPLGLSYIALSTPKELVCLKCQFQGNRLQVKTQATTQALELLLEFLPEV